MNNFIKKLTTLILCVILLCVSVSSYAQVDSSYSISTTIEFVINTDNIIQNANYYNYLNIIVPAIKENKNNIDYILLIGSASPEGNYNKNLILADKRADKIYSYISSIIPRSKIIKNNNYDLFLMKTGFDESDYTKLRATYIEIHFLKKDNNESSQNIKENIDTVYIEREIRDTVYFTFEKNNYYYYPKEEITKPILSIYNNVTSNFLLRANIGAEIYFNKMSFFLEGSFSNWPLLGKNYNIDLWYTGFRKYFNYDYDKWFVEVYGNVGYFDTEIFGDIGKVGILYGGGIGFGYTFNLCPHWKISPTIRIGLFEKLYYANYYYIDNGNINIEFGNYSDGKGYNPDDVSTINNIEVNKITIDKVINKDFIDKSTKAFYFGPTYIGITIKRDFCINKKIYKQTR